MAAAPATITSTLQNLFDDAGEDALVAAITVFWPPLGAIFQVPVLGGLLSSGLKWLVDGLIARGVIDIKVGLIDYLSDSAQTKWATELVILKQVNAAGTTLTAEQQAAFDAALQAIGENHPGVVNA